MNENIDLKSLKIGLNALYKTVEQITSVAQSSVDQNSGSLVFSNKDLNNIGIFWNDSSGTKKLVFDKKLNKFFSSQDFDLDFDRSYQIGGVDVLRSKDLGNSVINSNLQTLGIVKNFKTSGDFELDKSIVWNSKSKRLQIDSAVLSISKQDTVFEIESFDNFVNIGTKSATDLVLVTDDTARLTVSSSGVVSVGTKGSKSSQVNIYGTLGVGITNVDPRCSIDVSDPIGIQGKTIEYDYREPKDGYYKKGSIVFNSDPMPYKYIGWVCIKEGKPGIWKPFGKIED